MRLVVSFLFLAILAVTLPGCQKKKPEEKIYVVNGVVKSVDTNKNVLVVKHEEIPDFMPAMTMPLDVRKPAEMVGLTPGSEIRFRMHYTTNDLWIDQIQKTGQQKVEPKKGPQMFRRVKDVEPLLLGDPLPNYVFTNQLSEVVETKNLKGHAVAINFIFTRCPNPKACPLMSSRFYQVQQKLAASKTKNWRLLSLSIDPENDHPERLKAYARSYKADNSRWIFATGTVEEVNAVGDHFGLMFSYPDSGLPDHNLRTVVLNAAGKVHKIWAGEDWTVDDLVAEMEIAATVTQ